MSIKNIVLINNRGLGNAILLLPLIRTIRNKFKQARIIFTVFSSQTIELLRQESCIDEFILLSDNPLKACKNIIAISKIRKLNPDVSIRTFPTHRLAFKFISNLIRANTKIFHNYDNGYGVKIEQVHDVYQNLNLTSALDIKKDDWIENVKLRLCPDETKYAEAFLKQHLFSKQDLIIGIHPGSSTKSGMNAKRWPLVRFCELANKLKNKYDAKILFFLGPDEKHLLKYIKKHTSPNTKLVVAQSIRKVAAIISKCNLFISNDSGLMHLSSAVGTKVAAIFGSTDTLRISPFGDSNIVIKKDIPCSPCNHSLNRLGKKFRCTNPKKYKCIKDISVDNVLSTIKEVFLTKAE